MPLLLRGIFSRSPSRVLKEGGFGVAIRRKCELCGRLIPSERLEILPQTKRCVECAKKNGSDVTGRRTTVGMDVDTYKDLLRAVRT
jgi:hypothetical protein